LLFPFYWMLMTAIKPNRELYNLAINQLWTSHPTLVHFQTLLFKSSFLPWLRNTLVVSIGATALSLTASLLAAYAIQRLRFWGSAPLGVAIFLSYLVPQVILFIPLARVINALGLWDRPAALILTYPTFLIPFATWLLMGYFRAIPLELEDCARIDGAHRFQVIRHVTLPLALPGILSSLIFAFTLSWNEYLYALVFLSSSAHKTIPVGLATELITGDVFQWGPLMAGALLGSVPVALAYSFFVEHYVTGLTGALKE
jgi:multiple sugar transport system permease protein